MSLLPAKRKSKSACYDELRFCGVHQTEQMSHFEFCVRQRNCFLEKFDSSFQISSLYFDGAEGLVGKLALVVDGDGFLDVLGRGGDIALPLELKIKILEN